MHACVCVILSLSFSNKLSSQSVAKFLHGNWSMPHGVITPLCDKNEILLTLRFANNTGSAKDIRFLFFYNDSYGYPLEVNGVTSVIYEQQPGTLNVNARQITATATIPEGTNNQPFHDLITLRFFVKQFPGKSTDGTFDLISVTDISTNTTKTENDNTSVWRMVDHFPNDHFPANTIRPTYLLSELVHNVSGLPLFGTPRSAEAPIYVPVRFDIDLDFSMSQVSATSHDQPEIHLNPGAEITIGSSAVGLNTVEVNLEDALVTSCDGDWQSITVMPGNILEMTDCIVENGVNAIIMEPGSILRLDNVTFRNCDVAIISNGGNFIDIKNCIFENCTNGIQINGDPIVQDFSNNTFGGCSGTCITIRDNTSRLNIFPEAGSENIFDNSNKGIAVYNASAHIENNIFLDVDRSIILGSGPLSKIISNQIGSNDVGIEVIGADFEAIGNDIGIAGHIGHHGVDVLFSDDFLIDDNGIDAVETAVNTQFSSGSVHENRIGFISPPALGVDRFFGDDEVVDNEIFSRYTPVRSNSTFGEAQVNNNIMTSSKEGPIYIGGSTGNLLIENTITAGNNGVFFLNSLGSTINCNDISAGGDAIEVNANSDFHIIETNTLDAADQAVLTFSLLGVQRFNGNFFMTKSITSLGFFDADLSRFVIDEDSSFDPDELERDPVNANPPEFREATKRDMTYPECVGDIGSDLKHKFRDPVFACNYLNNIESYKESNPKYYWNAMYHMMRFYLLELPLNDWPDCIIAKWNDSLPCGIKSLLTKETELKKGISSMDDTATEDGVSAEEGGTEEGNTEGEQGDEVSIKEIAEEQLVELSEVQCTEELYLLWHDAYRFILKKVKGDTLTEQEKVRLSEIAQQCSPEYGDAVHWARALASEYDDTDYTQYDNNCDNVDARARTSSPYISEQLSLSPNPVSNIITIRSTTDDEHELLLLGVDGQVIDKINFTGYDVEYNVSQYQNGVYFIKDLNTSELLKFIKL